MAKLYNRAGVATTTTSTGTVTLGSAIAAATTPFACSYLTFANAGVANGEVVSYLILDVNGAWELGTGTYTTAGTTLTRTLTLSSTGALLNLSGNAQVFIVMRKEDMANLLQDNTFTGVNQFPNVGLKVLDTNASHACVIKPGTDVSAERIWTLAFGDAARTLTMTADTTLSGGTHSGTNTGDQTVPAASSQADQEAVSSTTTYVSPGRQHFHPGSLKVWVQWGVTTTVDASYNVSSITDNGTGDWTVNYSTGFSSANYNRQCTCQVDNDGTSGFGKIAMVKNTALASGSTRVIVGLDTDGGGFVNYLTDPAKNFFAAAGDQ